VIFPVATFESGKRGGAVPHVVVGAPIGPRPGTASAAAARSGSAPGSDRLSTRCDASHSAVVLAAAG
jgi:hypothetical protein